MLLELQCPLLPRQIFSLCQFEGKILSKDNFKSCRLSYANVEIFKIWSTIKRFAESQLCNFFNQTKIISNALISLIFHKDLSYKESIYKINIISELSWKEGHNNSSYTNR